MEPHNWEHLRNLLVARRSSVLGDLPLMDTSEHLNISPLALLKMLKHAKSELPTEVMGLMLGEIVDEYTIKVVDVFPTVDPEFRRTMMAMVKQTGRHEGTVGWYHSQPGYGCWLSGADLNFQKRIEAVHPRAVAVVIDPIQSVRGKVVIDAFRSIDHRTKMLGLEERQKTSNIGRLKSNRYYSISIDYRKNLLEENMCLNLHKKHWSEGLKLEKFDKISESNEEIVLKIKDFVQKYNKSVQEEGEFSLEKRWTANVGKQDAKKCVEEYVEKLMASNIKQTDITMLNTVIF